MKAGVAELKQEFASANAKRRTKLQAKIHRLESKIDEQHKRAHEWLEAFQKHQQAQRVPFELGQFAGRH